VHGTNDTAHKNLSFLHYYRTKDMTIRIHNTGSSHQHIVDYRQEA